MEKLVKEIKNVDDLVSLSKSSELWQGHFIQKSDLDMTGVDFTPIGNESIPFNGSFDGNGYEIKNLTINSLHGDNVGLFGYCDEKANIQSVQLTDCNITGADSVAGICGFNAGGRIEYCEVCGVIKSTELFPDFDTFFTAKT